MAERKEIIEGLERLKKHLVLETENKGYDAYIDTINEALDYIKTAQFRSELGLLFWLSAYYPAPKWSMTCEDKVHKQNCISWMKFMDELRISKGEEAIWDERIKEIENELTS